MDFYIRKGATLPRLKMKLVLDSEYDYNKVNDMLSNCYITFSMTDVETNVYKIANKPGKLVTVSKEFDCADGKTDEYYIVYEFTKQDTSKTGTYFAQFEINFDGDNCGNIIVPIRDNLYVHVQDSITKTTKL